MQVFYSSALVDLSIYSAAFGVILYVALYKS